MKAVESPTLQNTVRIYTRLAPLYTLWTFLAESRSLRVALERSNIKNGESILEIAVGTGVLFQKVLRQNSLGRNAGIDLTEVMLRRAQRRVSRSRAPRELGVGDARSLSFTDASFDLVLNNNMLGLLSDAEIITVLSEVLRVLRPGGRVVIANMVRPSNFLAKLIFEIGPVTLGAWREVRLSQFLMKVGFADLQSETISQFGLPSEIIVAKKPKELAAIK